MRRPWCFVGAAAVAAALMVFFFCEVVRETSLAKFDPRFEHGVQSSWYSVADDALTAAHQSPQLQTQPAQPINTLQKRTFHKFWFRTSPEFKKAVKTGKRILSFPDDKGPTTTTTTKPPHPSSPSARAKPEFNDPSDLKAWGWTSTGIPAETIKSTLVNYAIALKAKGFEIDSPTLRGVKWTHARETVHGGVTYPATGGEFSLLLDPAQGLLVPSSSYGPEYHVSHKKGLAQNWPPNAPLPLLRQWSDIAFLTWKAHTSASNRQTLHYILAINAINQDTVDVVSEALRKDGLESGIAPPWPGRSFSQLRSGSCSSKPAEVYAAVLGTPNVLGSGWLVVQHRGELGGRRLGALTVWDSSGFENSGGGVQLSVFVEVLGAKK